MSADECEYGLFRAIKHEVEAVRGMTDAVYSYDRATPHVSAASFYG